MTSPHTTHQQQIARALNRATGCGYQEALRRVREAADAGLLPAPLDAAGRATAVAHLADTPRHSAGSSPGSTAPKAAQTPDLPWSAVAHLANLSPGSVTALVSLPTAGRSTLALNIALHNAEHGRPALVTSAEIDEDQMLEKIISAKYAVDVQNLRRAGGRREWAKLQAHTKRDMSALPLLLHGAMVGSDASTSWRQATVTAARKRHRLQLWVVDTVQHFSELSEDGVDTAMHHIRELAQEYNIAVLATARVLTDSRHEHVRLHHVPTAITRNADTTLVLERNGVYWSNQPAETASLRRLDPSPTAPYELLLEAELCRFTPVQPAIPAAS